MEKLSNCIYGAVKSWRMGKSLGIDLLSVNSICSFDCVYCQLEKINRLTCERSVFVSTSKIIAELKNSDWRESEIITFSGSDEPTLAANLGETIYAMKNLTAKTVAVLTNFTFLSLKEVRAKMANANIVFCKLDAWNNEDFYLINCPHPCIRLETIIEGIKMFRREFSGKLAVQTVIMKSHSAESLRKFTASLLDISPDEVQLILPLRPIPKRFTLENRGNRSSFSERDAKIKTINLEQLVKIQNVLSALTNLPITIPQNYQPEKI